MESNLLGLLIPVMTLVMVIAMQIAFWFPTTADVKQSVVEVSTSVSSHSNNVEVVDLQEHDEERSAKKDQLVETSSDDSTRVQSTTSTELTGLKVVRKVTATSAQPSSTAQRQVSIPEKAKNNTDEGNNNNDNKEEEEEEEEDWFASNKNPTWRCACQNGFFLPAGMLKTFGSAEAVMRLGTGQCYHKQT